MTDAKPIRPAWYPDPDGSGQRRWWDGDGWTKHFRSGSVTDERPPVELGPASRLDTIFAWGILAVLALASVAGLIIDTGSPVARMSLSYAFSPSYWAALAPSIVSYAAIIALAFCDWRALRRVGVTLPFYWLWAFLGSIVYIIGRTVVLYRRTGRGLLIFWVWLALEAASIGVAIIELAVIR